jgi:predicted transcriptional regulator of viral defense system
VSKYAFRYDNHEILLVNGKNTKRLGVGPLVFRGEEYSATDLERTLIDVTVRPAYAGGVDMVLSAFRRARERVSVTSLLATLRKLDHVYPFHQAIGFYMQRAGYEVGEYEQLRRIGLAHDFFLDYRLVRPSYDSEWRIYYPATF